MSSSSSNFFGGAVLGLLLVVFLLQMLASVVEPMNSSSAGSSESKIIYRKFTLTGVVKAHSLLQDNVEYATGLSMTLDLGAKSVKAFSGEKTGTPFKLEGTVSEKDARPSKVNVYIGVGAQKGAVTNPLVCQIRVGDEETSIDLGQHQVDGSLVKLEFTGKIDVE